MPKPRKSVKLSERQGSRRAPARTGAAPHRDLATAIHALTADVSDAEWKKLPPNLASRVDEFLYDRDK
jgi:hypothetical protein